MTDCICSGLELFLIKRKIKGPSWLSISKFSNCATSQRVRLLTDIHVTLLEPALFIM